MKPINHGQSCGRSIPGSGSCNPPAAPSGPAGRAGSTGGHPVHLSQPGPVRLSGAPGGGV